MGKKGKTPKNDFTIIFGQRMAEAREKKEPRMTQEILGNLLGMTQSTISDYENGVQAPTIDKAVEIAKALDVPIDYLCGADRDSSSITGTQWLTYLMDLTENAPQYIQHISQTDERLEDAITKPRFHEADDYLDESYWFISFYGRDLNEFFSAYSAHKSNKGILPDDIYELGRRALLDKYGHLFRLCNGDLPF